MKQNIEEDIEELRHLNRIGNMLGTRKHIAIDNVLEYIDKLEEKLMYALAPKNHEFAIDTKRNFKKIIMKNIDEDTYTIKRELKKYWNNMISYWEEV